MVQVFHETMNRFGLTGITLEPGQDATVSTAPGQLHLSLNPWVQAGWQGLTLLTDTVRDKAEDELKRLLSNGSKSRRAALDCAFAAFKIGDTLSSDPRSPEEIIESGLVGDAKSCVDSIDKARSEGVVTVDQVKAKAKGSVWRTATRTMLNLAKKALRVRA